MTQKHTPTPWTVRPSYNNFKYGGYIDAGEKLIAGIGGSEFTGQENRANAAFIVRACNAHAAALEGLKRAQGFIDNLGASDSETYQFITQTINEMEA